MDCTRVMHSRTSPSSERYMALVRVLPMASIKAVWKCMSGSMSGGRLGDAGDILGVREDCR